VSLRHAGHGVEVVLPDAEGDQPHQAVTRSTSSVRIAATSSPPSSSASRPKGQGRRRPLGAVWGRRIAETTPCERPSAHRPAARSLVGPGTGPLQHRAASAAAWSSSARRRSSSGTSMRRGSAPAMRAAAAWATARSPGCARRWVPPMAAARASSACRPRSPDRAPRGGRGRRRRPSERT
jgi:hypothetical protein